jgi:large subunit ribosomal protein L10
MTRAEKEAVIDELSGKLSENDYFYLTDSSGLTVENVNNLRRLCFEKQIEMRVVKNTLLRKAMEKMDNDGYEPLMEVLKGPTSIMFCETGNVPAKLIKEFRKKNAKLEKPLLKAAYIDSAVYVGEDQLDALSQIKSKVELIGDVIALLQSPAKNVISGLLSGGQKLSGILKTLEERENN